MAQFNKINFSTWKRTPYFKHYFNQLRCSYSITTNLDITILRKELKKREFKLYPFLIYALTSIVNRHEEFRTSIDNNGDVGIWNTMNPSYTIFHKDSETFSEIWSLWNEDMDQFLENHQADMKLFGNTEGLSPKPDTPKNTFPISSLPWVTFTAFNLNIFEDGTYLLPIFTWGKYVNRLDNGEEKTLIPLSIQVHHAVCDGYHLSRFVNELQEFLNREI